MWLNTHSFSNWLQGYYLLILEVSNQFGITELKSRCWHDSFPQKLRGESGSCSFGCWQSSVPSLGSGAIFLLTESRRNLPVCLVQGFLPQPSKLAAKERQSSLLYDIFGSAGDSFLISGFLAIVRWYKRICLQGLASQICKICMQKRMGMFSRALGIKGCIFSRGSFPVIAPVTWFGLCPFPGRLLHFIDRLLSTGLIPSFSSQASCHPVCKGLPLMRSPTCTPRFTHWSLCYLRIQPSLKLGSLQMSLVKMRSQGHFELRCSLPAVWRVPL